MAAALGAARSKGRQVSALEVESGPTSRPGPMAAPPSLPLGLREQHRNRTASLPRVARLSIWTYMDCK